MSEYYCKHGQPEGAPCDECAAKQEGVSSFAAPPCSVESTTRHVIENQLLAALDDKTKVAILANEMDLRIIITALEQYSGGPQRELATDMRQLLNAAFPQNTELSDAKRSDQ